MGKMLKVIMTAALVCNVATTFADIIDIHDVQNEDGLELGVPAYGGSGCPAKSLSLSIDQEAGGLSLRFDKYAAQLVKNGSRNVRVTCNMAIPLHIPQGISVSVIAVDYKGYLSIPKKGQARFTTEYFFAGSKGPRFDRIFPGGSEGPFSILDGVVLESQVWSKCGEDTILRLNSAVVLSATKKRDEGVFSIDSADIASGIVYKLQTKKCE